MASAALQELEPRRDTWSKYVTGHTFKGKRHRLHLLMCGMVFTYKERRIDGVPLQGLYHNRHLGLLCCLDELTFLTLLSSAPGGSDGKVSACNAGDLGLLPGSGRFPGEENGNPLQYSCLENSRNREAWSATVVHGVAKSMDVTEQLTHTTKTPGFEEYYKA